MKRLLALAMAISLTACMSLPQLNTALLEAARAGDVSRLKNLLERGAQIDSESRLGETPLLVAVRQKHADAAKFLLEQGASPNVGRPGRDTPLHLAVRNGDTELARSLLAKGANPSAAGVFGDTPLHVSVYRSDEASSTLLREHGADEALANRYGLIPRDMRELPALQDKIVAAAALLTSSGSWTDSARARTLYNELRARQDKFLVNSVVLQVVRGASTRRNTLILAIKLGISGSEDQLSTVLTLFGDKSMAEDYLNCGSNKLEEAARKWAESRGYQIMRIPGGARATWGRF